MTRRSFPPETPVDSTTTSAAAEGAADPTELENAHAESERLRQEADHWRGLYEALVVDTRANITDAEGQIEMARDHIEQLEVHLADARGSESRFRREVDEWRERHQDLSTQSRRNADDAAGQIDSARENIVGLASQLEDAAQERVRLVAEIEYWSERAENQGRFASGGRFARWSRRLREGRLQPTARSPVSPAVMRARGRVSHRFLSGQGLELGALHSPTPVAKGVVVRYVDRLTRTEQRTLFSELRDFSFVEVDLVDDGERLNAIEDASVDFVIASHMLEHCENPLGTLRNHLRKLRTGGHLFYILPDRRFSFDIDRAVTPFEHLIRDDRDGPETSRRSHYLEYAKLVDHTPDDEIENAVRKMEAVQSNIHFHVWDQSAAEELWKRAQDYLDLPFSIEYTEFNWVENIAVLRRLE